jgi:hypothetical protein
MKEHKKEKEGENKLETEIHSHGLAPKLPHAQHIHGFEQAVSECPTLAASGRDNLLTDSFRTVLIRGRARGHEDAWPEAVDDATPDSTPEVLDLAALGAVVAVQQDNALRHGNVACLVASFSRNTLFRCPYNQSAMNSE